MGSRIPLIHVVSDENSSHTSRDLRDNSNPRFWPVVRIRFSVSDIKRADMNEIWISERKRTCWKNECFLFSSAPTLQFSNKWTCPLSINTFNSSSSSWEAQEWASWSPGIFSYDSILVVMVQSEARLYPENCGCYMNQMMQIIAPPGSCFCSHTWNVRLENMLHHPNVTIR